MIRSKVSWSLPDTARALLPHAGWLGLLAAVCFGATYEFTNLYERLALLTVGVTLLCFVVFVVLVAAQAGGRAGGRLVASVQNDPAPIFITTEDGGLKARNAAARARFGPVGDSGLTDALGTVFASPSGLIHRLRAHAAAHGAAQEDMRTRGGQTRVTVHRDGAGHLIWRMDQLPEADPPAEAADSVALPMLVASKSGTVLFVNDAMRTLLGGRPRTLDEVFSGPVPGNGEEATVKGADGPVRALVTEVEGACARREVYLLPVPEAGAGAGEEAAHDGAAVAWFEDLPIALVRIGPDGIIAGANRDARDLLGLRADEAVPFADIVEGLGRPVADWVEDARRGRLAARSEVLRAHRFDDDRYLQIALRRTVEGGQPAVLAVINDATELKSLEAQFVQSQKMQAIGQLAGGVAHDFNNLLTAISGHCDLLLLRHEGGDPDYADLVQIHQNANRAASLVGQLLAFSRKQTLKPEEIDLRETLADLTHLLNRLVGERVTLKFEHDESLNPIRADKRHFEQILMNLVVNARDAMPEGGEVTIETENCTLTSDLQRDRATVAAGDYVVVRVRDQGVGISEEALPKIFEPFYTTKRTGEGTGLGLSTVYGIVKQTGGFIFADSVPGHGTTFTIYMPAFTPAEPAPAPAPEAAPAPGTGAGPRHGDGVVLLVEDEAPVRAFASRALQMRGYTVIEAANAEDALETLEDPGLNVDIFVTDVIMPGMDGPSWVREALKDRPDTRVIFVSGYAEEAFNDAQMRIPNSVFLQKPFSLTELTETVQRQLQ